MERIMKSVWLIVLLMGLFVVPVFADADGTAEESADSRKVA